MFERFGRTPYGEILKRVQTSPNYIKGAFRNKETTPPELMPKNPAGIFLEFATRERDSKPHGRIPTVKTDLKNIQTDTPSIVWLGHSSYFIFWKGKTILVDPILSSNVSPIYKSVVAFHGTEIYSIQDYPKIDLLVFTHDHYDHLDYYTVLQVHQRAEKIVCPLGVDAHLIFWGVDKKKIQALDWDETFTPYENMKITALTTRHSSGRTFKRDQSLWCAYFLQLDEYKLFLAGDGGFGKHFEIIGKKYGPFDFGLIENGQYNTSWPAHHMFPEQSAEAAQLLNLKTVMPIHWGKFSLAFHKWNDSIQRFVKVAQERELNYCVPKIGQVYTIGETPFQEKWWNFD